MGRISLQDIPWARRLKLRHLEVFLALHECGSLTAAATELHMTQPAMSHWLADVEEVVGCPLFLRKRRLELTDAGRVLLAHARRMLGDARRTHVELTAVQAGLQGRLLVGTTMPSSLLPRAIARLQESRPGIFVTVIEASLADMLERLGRREIDALIGAVIPQAREAGFATEALLEDTVRVVARQGHPLLERAAAGGALHWDDVAAYPWIMPPVGSVTRGRLDEVLGARQVTLTAPSVEASASLRVQLLLTGARDYLSVLTASELRTYQRLRMIEALELAPEIDFPDIGVVWSEEGASHLVGHLLEALRATAQDL